MPLRAKWLIFVVLVACMLAAAAWLNLQSLDDRHHRMNQRPASDNRLHGFNSPDSNGPKMLPTHYKPREYVKIISRER
jgi:hypothetical protein